MRTSTLTHPPLSRLEPRQKLALGAGLAAVGGTVIVLSMLLGWNELVRPWSFIVGFVGGLTGGLGVTIAICGLTGLARGSDSSEGDITNGH